MAQGDDANRKDEHPDGECLPSGQHSKCQNPRCHKSDLSPNQYFCSENCQKTWYGFESNEAKTIEQTRLQARRMLEQYREMMDYPRWPYGSPYGRGRYER